ncbi:DUF5680 domain-containing protein [Kribbella catacumbae]|uniref:DUF5680 domain-containing protein n=1 Tax=Kribbella catacumbae TaxID=460086 RepID=UPI000382AA0D|nr:DUF5680 domain-containing protein [Kribbella catacumbae]
MITSEELEAFIVRAKAASYVGDGDLRFTDGDLEYCDSYFGGADFPGQEVVCLGPTPIWGMNYYGYLLTPDVLDVEGAERIETAAGTTAYRLSYHGGRILV